MAKFVKHTACPNCGSSDANAQYSDGGAYCFSCGKPSKSKIIPYALHNDENAETLQQQPMSYPADATKDFSTGAMEWFKKYDITIETILQNEIYFSPSRNQIMFGFCDGEGHLVAYQARNLTPINKAKRYYTKGDVNEILPIYHNVFSRDNSVGDEFNICTRASSSRMCVLVEDCLSALKVASLNSLGADAMPLLGSGIGLSKLTRLRAFYDVLTVWLDSNMLHKAQNIAQQAQMLGFKTKVVYSELDPKCYNEQKIKEYLDDN